MIKVVVFDFDDTLVPSERIKQTAFVEVFSSIPGARTVAQDYLAKNFGYPRNKTISDILNILKKEGLIAFQPSEQVVDDFVRKFAELVDDNVIREREVAGAGGVLKLLNEDGYPLYLNSNTPQKSLDRIIDGRGWRVFFEVIYGSPPGSKSEHLEKIVKDCKVSPREVVVIGDGQSDRDSAKKSGTFFIGIKGEFSSWSDDEKDLVILNSLKEVPKFIQQANF